MDLTSSIWGFVQAPIIHILRERMKNRDSIKKLLQNKDAMEDVIRGLTEMLDQLERRVSSPGIENSTKTELFNKLEKSVRELHASMQEIKEAYRNSQTGVRFFLKSMKGYCRDRVHRKLRDQFEDVVEAIDHMESSIGSINVKSAVVNAIVQVIKSPNVRETLSAILVEKWAICKVTVN
ncbi:hypothetical protein AtubIFM61612_009940 [Aspergillus tubingensis]|nr:hypothetical protein AtubIFM61612_009940 [Aspergillus tubingensis]